jgi:HAD superfamily hydrolase (TIGR01509 family)
MAQQEPTSLASYTCPNNGAFAAIQPSKIGFLLDLDGTLIDSVYMQVLAWQGALQRAGVNLAIWRIHRRIGMSGGLMINALAREVEREFSNSEIEQLQLDHESEYAKLLHLVRPLPGANELLATLSQASVPIAIATSGRANKAFRSLEILEVPTGTPIITREDVRHAKPDPDLFITAALRLGLKTEECLVVGDSVWDILAARRARSLGVGLLSGGYGREELVSAGAYRVYDDPADLLDHLDEVGVRSPRS